MAFPTELEMISAHEEASLRARRTSSASANFAYSENRDSTLLMLEPSPARPPPRSPTSQLTSQSTGSSVGSPPLPPGAGYRVQGVPTLSVAAAASSGGVSRIAKEVAAAI